MLPILGLSPKRIWSEFLLVAGDEVSTLAALVMGDHTTVVGAVTVITSQPLCGPINGGDFGRLDIRQP